MRFQIITTRGSILRPANYAVVDTQLGCGQGDGRCGDFSDSIKAEQFCQQRNDWFATETHRQRIEFNCEWRYMSNGYHAWLKIAEPIVSYVD